MRINPINNINTYYTTENKAKQRNNNDEKVQYPTYSSTTGNSKPPIWEQLGDKYDVRNTTFDEICNLGQELYAAKEISLKELGTLTIDLSKLDRVKNTSDIAKFYRGKKDWIKAFEERAKTQLSYGNRLGYHSLMKSAQYLEKTVK